MTKRIIVKLTWLAAIGLPAVAVAAPKHHKPAHVAKIAIDQARTTALAKVPGTVKAEELEHEGGRWIYSFEIKPDGEKRKIIKEVNVDADDGTIVGKIDEERE